MNRSTVLAGLLYGALLAGCGGSGGGEATPPPAAPTGVSAAAGDGQVTVSWTASSGATSYNVYYSAFADVSKANGTRLAGAVSGAAVSGLANGTPYWFVVTAVNAGGESAESSPAATATPLPPIPAAPTAVVAASGDGQATVSWSASSGATSYNVYYSTSAAVSKANGTRLGGAVSGGAVTGLTNGVAYYFVVTAENLGGESAESSPAATATPLPLIPAAPTAVVAIAGDGQATVSWTASSGATSYNVYYSTSAAVSKASGTRLAGAVSGGAVTGLTNGVAYYFVVTAENLGGESAESSPAATATPLPPIPAAPTAVVAIAGDGQATVSWTASSGATSYNLYYSTSAGVSKANGTRIANAVGGGAVTGLASGATYWFVVTAVNLGGESGESSPAASATLVPAPPAGVTAVAANGQATVTWTASSGATSYNVYYSTSAAVSKASGTKVTGAVSGGAVTGLANGSTYYFVVTAVNLGGESAESAPVASTTLVAAPPSGVVAIASDGLATVSWTASAGALSYNLYYSTSASVSRTNGTKLANAVSGGAVSGLTNGSTYYFVVTAVNAGGESAESSPAASARPLPPMPAVPTGVLATAGDGVVTVTWTSSSGATSYNVYYSTSADVSKGTGTKLGGVSSGATVGPLTNGTAYWFVVTAENLAGESAESSPAATATPLPPLPAPPLLVTATAGDAQATVSWVASSGATSYNLYWSTSDTVSKANGTQVTGAVSGGAVTGLANGSTYYFVVTAVNLGGESAESAPVASTTLVPAPPTGVSASAGDAQATVSWTSSSGAVSYNLYYSTSNTVSKANGTKLTGAVSGGAVTGLTNETTYYFVVTAVNAGGESAESTPVASARPLPPIPAPPSNVAAAAGDTQATVSWTASAGATSYNVYWSTSDTVSKTNGTQVTGVASGDAIGGLTNGTTYYFVVTAVNAGGESSESSPAASAMPLPPLPAPPTGVTVGAGLSQAKVSWTASPDAASYNLYYSTSPTVSKTSGTKLTGAVVGKPIFGLTPGTPYYFVVTAVDSFGREGADSSPAAQGTPLPAVLGNVAYSGAGGTDLAVDSTRKRAYVSGSIAQSGLVRIDATNPASMTQVALPYGGGVAADSQTGRWATTNGWGATLFVFDATDNLVDTETLTGCPGTMDSDSAGGRFFVSSQCSDRLAVYSEASMSLAANVVSNGVGSGVVFDPSTGTAYQNLTPNSAAGGVTAPLAVTQAYTTSVPFTGYVRAAGGGRIYVAANNGDFVVRDSSSYATLRTFPATSFSGVAADVSVGVFYASSGGTITAYDATTYATAATITLPVTIQNMRMVPGDDRLYVVGGGRLFVIKTRGSGSGPATPTGVSAVAGNQQATVSWTASAGAASYNVYYSTSASVSKTNGTRVLGAVSGGAIAGLVNGTTYYFVVTAVDSFGESAESAVVTATPQQTDRVMVLLGWDAANNGIGSAQVYDASTNSWSAPTTILAPNGYASSNAAVTVLANGQVMVAGGGAGDNYSTTNTVRLWTPSTNSWAYGAPMAYGRNGFALLTLADGTALAAGGCAGGCSGPNVLGQFVNTVGISSERFGGSSWTTQGTLTTRRAGLTSPVQLPDGRVMVCGGNDGFSTTYSSCEFYRTSTGAWTSSAILLPDPGARQMLLVGTKVLVLNQTGTVSYYWDSASDPTFAHVAALATPQPGGRMTLLADGRVMLVGGYVNGGAYNALPTVQIWSPTTNTWAAAAPMITPRAYPAVVTLRDGRVFVVAGNGVGSGNSQPLASAEIWNPGTGSWMAVPPSAIPRNSPSAVLLK